MGVLTGYWPQLLKSDLLLRKSLPFSHNFRLIQRKWVSEFSRPLSSEIVSKRLPSSVRRQHLRERPKSDEREKRQKQEPPPPIVQKFLKLSLPKSDSSSGNLGRGNYNSSRLNRSRPQILKPLAEEALLQLNSLQPIHIAEILRCCARLAWTHPRMIQEALHEMTHPRRRCDVHSMVVAILALRRLQWPTDVMVSRFAQLLTTSVDQLPFHDLKLALLAIARLQLPTKFEFGNIATEFQYAMLKAIKREYLGPLDENNEIDSREFLVLPYCLSRTGTIKDCIASLLKLTDEHIRAVVASRLRCIPLDSLQAMDGYIALGDQKRLMARRLTLFSKFILEEAPNPELLMLPSGFRTLNISAESVWNVWADEVEARSAFLRRAELQQVIETFVLLGRKTRKLEHYLNTGL